MGYIMDRTYKNNIQAPVTNKRPIILCFLSGGLDSFGLGWHLLTDERFRDFDIFFHHTHLINREKRDEQEKIASRNFIKFCEDTFSKKLNYTENIMDFDFLDKGQIEPDLTFWAFQAAIYCNNNYSIKHIAIGQTKTDVEDGSRQRLYVKRSKEIFQATLNYQRKGSVTIIHPVIDIRKDELYAQLPKTLKKMFWSCRFPQEGKPCGSCDACIKLKELGIPHPVF